MILTEIDRQNIVEALARHFTAEQLRVLGDHPIDKNFRKQLSSIDIEFFCQFYLGEHFSDPMSTVHQTAFVDLLELMATNGKAQHVEVWPRGFGKSTILGEAFPLWAVCNKLRWFILITSDSLEQAKAHLHVIKEELESNERLREDYGDLVSRKVWRQESIVTTTGVRITALGSGTKMRGLKEGTHRPDLIVLDDIENNRLVRSPTQRETLSNWLLGAVLPAGAPDCKTVMIGNFIHYACILKKCFDDPMWNGRVYQAIHTFADRRDLWAEWEDFRRDKTDDKREVTAQQFYEDNQEEMLLGTEVEWPDREGYDYVGLMNQLVTLGPKIFFTEFQNEPNDPSNRFFRYHTYMKRLGLNEQGLADVFLVPWDENADDGNGAPSGAPEVPLSMCTLYAATDPSLGKSEKSDFSAILIGAKAPDGRGFVLEADLKKRTPEQIIAAQNKWLSLYPQIVRWVIESNQFQAYFASEAAKASMAAGSYGRYVAEASTGSKEMRIESIQPDLWNGYVLLCRDGQAELRKQLDEYPNSANDDGPDTLEMLTRQLQSDDSPESTSITMATSHHFFKKRKPIDAYWQDELEKEDKEEESGSIFF